MSYQTGDISKWRDHPYNWSIIRWPDFISFQLQIHQLNTETEIHNSHSSTKLKIWYCPPTPKKRQTPQLAVKGTKDGGERLNFGCITPLFIEIISNRNDGFTTRNEVRVFSKTPHRTAQHFTRTGTAPRRVVAWLAWERGALLVHSRPQHLLPAIQTGGSYAHGLIRVHNGTLKRPRRTWPIDILLSGAEILNQRLDVERVSSRVSTIAVSDRVPAAAR